MSEKRAVNDIIGFMLGLTGILVLFYPDRSPPATQMYIFGSIMMLVKNFFDTMLQPPRVRRGKKTTRPPPATPQPSTHSRRETNGRI